MPPSHFHFNFNDQNNNTNNNNINIDDEQWKLIPDLLLTENTNNNNNHHQPSLNSSSQLFTPLNNNNNNQYENHFNRELKRESNADATIGVVSNNQDPFDSDCNINETSSLSSSYSNNHHHNRSIDCEPTSPSSSIMSSPFHEIPTEDGFNSDDSSHSTHSSQSSPYQHFPDLDIQNNNIQYQISPQNFHSNNNNNNNNNNNGNLLPILSSLSSHLMPTNESIASTCSSSNSSCESTLTSSIAPKKRGRRPKNQLSEIMSSINSPTLTSTTTNNTTTNKSRTKRKVVPQVDSDDSSTYQDISTSKDSNNNNAENDSNHSGEDDCDANGVPLSKRARNKLSASLYRKRRKQYVDELEHTVSGMKNELNEQKTKMREMEIQNKTLISQLSFLQQLLGQSDKGQKNLISATGVALFALFSMVLLVSPESFNSLTSKLSSNNLAKSSIISSPSSSSSLLSTGSNKGRGLKSHDEIILENNVESILIPSSNAKIKNNIQLPEISTADYYKCVSSLSQSSSEDIVVSVASLDNALKLTDKLLSPAIPESSLPTSTCSGQVNDTACFPDHSIITAA